MSSILPTPSIQLARSLSVNPEDLESMSPFDLFCRQLESGSAEAAVDAMKRVSVVAIAMGENAVVQDMLPYLTQLVMQQPPPVDELLLLLGQQLIPVTQFLEHVVTDFLPMLERLAAVEETVVREQAVVVLVSLAERCRQYKQQHANKSSSKFPDASQWLALIKRLASADWFTAKVSAAGVCASVLALLDASTTTGSSTSAAAAPQDETSATTTTQAELVAVYKELCQDETPMVRRAAAKHLGSVLKEAGWMHREFAATVVPALARDEQDSVRLLAVASLAQVGTAFGMENPAWTIQYWLPIIKEGSTDMSWYVWPCVVRVLLLFTFWR